MNPLVILSRLRPKPLRRQWRRPRRRAPDSPAVPVASLPPLAPADAPRLPLAPRAGNRRRQSRQVMSAQDNAQRNIHLCNCNGTMPLDAARARTRAGARRTVADPYAALPKESWQPLPIARAATCLSRALRRRGSFGDVAEDAGKDADDTLRQHSRERGMVEARRRAPYPRSRL